jgi:hypothetical protein
LEVGKQEIDELEVGNPGIRGFGSGKSRNPERWRWEIAKHEDLEVGNREIDEWKSRIPRIWR